jgi:hypothetical protein
MNILETLKAKRARLDAVVDAAIAERDKFIACITDAVGEIPARRKRRKRRQVNGKQKTSKKLN